MEEIRNLFEDAIVKRFEEALKSEGFVDPIVTVFYGTTRYHNQDVTYVGCKYIFNDEFTYKDCIGENEVCSTIERLLFDTDYAKATVFAQEAKTALKNYLFKKAIKTF